MRTTAFIIQLVLSLVLAATAMGCSRQASQAPPPQQATIPKHELRWCIEYKGDQVKFTIWNNSQKDLTGIRLSLFTPMGELYLYHDPTEKYRILSESILKIDHTFFRQLDSENDAFRFSSDKDIRMLTLQSDQGSWKLNPPSGLYQKL